MNQDASAPLVELAGVHLARGGRRVLDIDHLAVRRGQVLSLSGANGSGKTSLLKLMAGLLIADGGTLRCLGTSMRARAAARFCRGRHVYLHQVPYLFDGTVEDNVDYGLKLRGRDPAQRRVEIRDALAWAELDHLLDRPARQLSGGEQQRVALVRARILAPTLLLLDEITANMDRDSRRRTYAMVEDLRQCGSSVVFASHDAEALAALGDTALVLAAGRLGAARPAPAAIIRLAGRAARPDTR
ncbi:MAG: ABC transporter ATP-binding protein [Gammaproteobacteria bacterium]|nr:ABC transporter ATP-binding protein [Gammaproteobacteria bacterium]